MSDPRCACGRQLRGVCVCVCVFEVDDMHVHAGSGEALTVPAWLGRRTTTGRRRAR